MLYLYFILIATLFYSTNGQAVEEFNYLEKDLPYFNLFRFVGQWVLRATTDKSPTSNRNIDLVDNKVIATVVQDGKAIRTHTLTHIKDSKIVSGVGQWNGKEDNVKYIFLHQDQKVVISVTVRGTQHILRVAVNSNFEVTDETLRNLISQKLLSNSGIRRLIKDLVPNLEYIPKPSTLVVHGAEFLTIPNSDLVDVDLTKIVGNWTLRAISDKAFAIIPKSTYKLEDDNVVIYSNQGAKSTAAGTLEYLGGTRILITKSFGEKFAIFKDIYIYADESNVVSVLFYHDKPVALSVVTRDEAPIEADCDEKWFDKLTFSSDVKQLIKDLLPKLTWIK